MIRVVISNRQRARRVAVRPLASVVARIAAEHGIDDADEVSLMLVSDRRMAALNRLWRGKTGTTDVLSFPSGPHPPGGAERSLGDIVISVPRAAEQAREHGHSLPRELRVLAVHGLLHLLGYDHDTDDGTMMRTQRRLLRRAVARGEHRS